MSEADGPGRGLGWESVSGVVRSGALTRDDGRAQRHEGARLQPPRRALLCRTRQRSGSVGRWHMHVATRERRGPFTPRGCDAKGRWSDSRREGEVPAFSGGSPASLRPGPGSCRMKPPPGHLGEEGAGPSRDPDLVRPAEDSAQQVGPRGLRARGLPSRARQTSTAWCHPWPAAYPPGECPAQLCTRGPCPGVCESAPERQQRPRSGVAAAADARPATAATPAAQKPRATPWGAPGTRAGSARQPVVSTFGRKERRPEERGRARWRPMTPRAPPQAAARTLAHTFLLNHDTAARSQGERFAVQLRVLCPHGRAPVLAAEACCVLRGQGRWQVVPPGERRAQLQKHGG